MLAEADLNAIIDFFSGRLIVLGLSVTGTVPSSVVCLRKLCRVNESQCKHLHFRDPIVLYICDVASPHNTGFC